MTMTVGELVKELSEYPKSWKVAYAHQDNFEHEIAGDVTLVIEVEKEVRDHPECNIPAEVKIILRG